VFESQYVTTILHKLNIEKAKLIGIPTEIWVGLFTNPRSTTYIAHIILTSHNESLKEQVAHIFPAKKAEDRETGDEEYWYRTEAMNSLHHGNR